MNMPKEFRYRIVTEWSDEDRVFVSRVPALPGCAAHGDTPEEAAKEARFAAENILDIMKKQHSKVPAEDVAADYSGKLNIRIASSLHQRLSEEAAVEGVSLNTL